MSHAPNIPASFSPAAQSAVTPAVAVACVLNGVAAAPTLVRSNVACAALSTAAGPAWFSTFNVTIPGAAVQPLDVVVTALENGVPLATIVAVPGTSQLTF